MTPSNTEVFHTLSMPKNARIRYWNDAARSVFGAIAIEPMSGPFTGHMQHWTFGAVDLARVKSTPVMVNGSWSSHRNGIFLIINQYGSCEVQQRGRSAQLQPGELSVICVNEPYTLNCSREHVADVLYVPAQQLESVLEDHIGTALSVEDSALLRSFVGHLSNLEWRDRVPGSLLNTTLDLIDISWPGTRSRCGHASADTWELRLRQHVQQHFTDPELNVRNIADTLGISVRYVQSLFTRMHTTASNYILECRLQAVAARLGRDPHSRIGDIALEAGFSDLSHFCHCFRQRFDISAREFRKREFRHQAERHHPPLFTPSPGDN